MWPPVEYQRGQSKQFRCLSEAKSFEYSTLGTPPLLIDQLLASILNPD